MVARAGVLLGSLLLLASCGEEAEPEAREPTTAPASTSPTPSGRAAESPPSAAPSPPVARGATVVVEDSEFGPMLFDDTGQAIYLFDVETTAEPRCYDACAAAWPPVLTRGEPVAGRGVDAALLGTTERSDGRRQVTYNGHPLYFYAHEGKHEVLCHDVFLNGGNWYVVQPGGSAAPPG